MCGGGGGTSGKEFSGHGVCVDITVGLVVFFVGVAQGVQIFPRVQHSIGKETQEIIATNNCRGRP